MSGIGNKYKVQSLSNCFVVDSPHDSYGGIMLTDQEQAQMMKRRKSVDVLYWPRLIELMAGRGIVLTSDDLVQMAVKRREAA